MKMNKKGFTLIEMLVVIAIIAVLVSIIVPTVTSSSAKAKAAADAANLRSVLAEAQIYVLNNDISGDATLTGNVTAVECETNSGWALAVTMNDGVIEAKFGDKDIDYFADIADGAEAEEETTKPTEKPTEKPDEQ